MIGEGYGYMKELALTMRELQSAIENAKVEGASQRGEIGIATGKLTIVFK